MWYIGFIPKEAKVDTLLDGNHDQSPVTWSKSVFQNGRFVPSHMTHSL